ncbi:uncharacterized protein LOC116348371 [Contarinia nasturtii]|uniref:uncharacterized protein LOC116348371 n=1 Tax=Contarinia nasturtii TaxID=265458 RepID=UPI0012D399DF|nr:uncharacterized protein LOC116348371 [Contarinia nasturtii]
MIIFLSVVPFLLVISGCDAAGGGCISGGCFGPAKEKEVVSIDDFHYTGDPVTFACISSSSQTAFFVAEANSKIPVHLVGRLDNGKGMSLFFLGIGNVVSLKNGLLFDFANEWFTVSGNNVCFISYAFKKTPSSGLFNDLDKMVTTRRFEYVAKLARDLITGIIEKGATRNFSLKSMSQVDVSGFSFGAHIAGRTCQYLEEKTGEKVRMLLALDPSKTPPILVSKPLNTIKKGHAKYVQVIHTSKVAGQWDRLGDIDVYVRFQPETSFFRAIDDKHSLSFFIHVATATKRLYLVADQNEKGKGTVIATEPMPKANECLVGIYGNFDSNIPGGKYVISLKNQSDVFWAALGKLSNNRIFF